MFLKRIDRYIIKEVLIPLTITLIIAALLLVLEKMLSLFDFVVNQGGPVEVVFRMLANLTPKYIGLALPIGLLLGIILAFRKLSLSSELDVIKATGTGLTRLLRPLFLLTFIIMSANFYLVGWIQPHSQYAYEGLVFELRSGALGASIKVGEFVNIDDNTVLRIGSSQNQGANLGRIFLERRKPSGDSIAVTAKRGGFFSTSDVHTIILRLEEGSLIDLNEASDKPRVLNFDRQDLKLRLPEVKNFRERGGAEREMTLPELFQNLNRTDHSEKDYNAIRGEYHWRVMHTLTFLLLPFLAMPLGVVNRRNSKATGLIFGISILIIYNELMEGMETAIAVKGMSPYLTIWALFSMLAATSFFIFYVTNYKVGGEPLRWFEVLFRVLASPFKAILKRLKRRIL